MATADDDTTLQPRMQRTSSKRYWTLRVLFSAGGVPSLTVHRMSPGVTMVGRGRDVDVALPDAHVSRCHAAVHLRGDTVIIQNKSRHGTRVNGRVVDHTVLEDGDVLRLGDSFVLLRAEIEPSPKPTVSIEGFGGDSSAAAGLQERCARAAASDLDVLIVGETGTGKELLARGIHALGDRDRPFIAANCSAIPEQLAESELFGHLRGAFTGAERNQPGYFRAAHGGTLFLDEVGELSRAVQPKLLRALEQREIVPVGSADGHRVELRVIAATNRLLRDDVNAGTFRGDLYARLAQLVIVVPPLRDRLEDVLPILMSRLGVDVTLSPDLVDALLLYDWPFNVRELIAVARELALFARDNRELTLPMVGDRLAMTGERTSHREHSVDPPNAVKPADRGRPPSRAELAAAMRAHDGVVADVARAMGRSRKQIYRWLEKHDLDAADFRSAEPEGRTTAERPPPAPMAQCAHRLVQRRQR